MTREQIVSFSLIALLLFIIYQVLALLSPFTTAIFWAGILAFTFYPFYKKARQALPINETLTAIVFTAIIILVVVPPVIMLGFSLTQQAVELYQSAADYIRQGRLTQLINDLRNFPAFQNIQERVPQWDVIQGSLSEWLLNTTKSFGNYTASQAAILTKNTLFVLLNLFLMVILVFIFFRDGERIYMFFYNVAPLEKKNKQLIFEQLNNTFAAVIRGQLLTSVVQSIAAGTIYVALGIPTPLLFAALTFLLSLIPLLGAPVVWLPLVIYLYVQQFYIKAAILLFLGVFFISLIDNVIKPLIIGEKVRLPYFLLFFGMMGGIKVYGLMGIFLAPVVLSMFFALIQIYREKYVIEKS